MCVYLVLLFCLVLLLFCHSFVILLGPFVILFGSFVILFGPFALCFLPLALSSPANFPERKISLSLSFLEAARRCQLDAGDMCSMALILAVTQLLLLKFCDICRCFSLI